ncbi:MAG: adenylate/guanylate cyclase domain-containing protein [Gammaproteobacteria bacterium]|jgi:adenylate cyclase
MTRQGKALLLGILTGLFGVVVSSLPVTHALEESIGLDLLFKLRGTRTPPADVVVVSIDKLSAHTLGLPEEPAKWPRSIHAQLVNRLAAAGASVISLDIFFREARDPGEDRLLAQAIRDSNRVVLFAYTRKQITRMFDASGKYTGEMISQQLLPPVAELATAARTTAPFPLPVYPVRVSQYWAFTSGTGDLPTLPVAALQLHAAAVMSDFKAGVAGQARVTIEQQGVSGGDPESSLVREMQSLRTTFTTHPDLGPALQNVFSPPLKDRFNGQRQELLLALLGLYSGPDSRHLNFYGPPQTITTIPYARILAPDNNHTGETMLPDLQGKAVFVGYSERLHPEQLDEFYTVYSQDNGLNLSGVEIAATAFANLLEDLPVTPLPLPALYGLLLTWGILAGTLVRLLPAVPAVLGGIGLAVLYLGSSHVLFSHSAVWLPLLVPLGMQLPLALFAALLWHYLDVNRERETIRSAFGLYLPPQVVDELAGERADARTAAQLMHGTCLSTDACEYTRMSEAMPPAELGELMNAYYETLFQPVRNHNGIISDVVGDAMLAIWAAVRREPRIQRHAIQAALEISRALDTAAKTGLRHALKTRIGLHSGEILLGSIGAMDHYEYRAVGDIVNTSTRIQGLNAHLGTQILLSGEVIAGVNGLQTRELGGFILSGKSRPVVIHELLGMQDDPEADRRSGYLARFAEGLAAFRAGDWHTAASIFTALQAENSQDGVLQFFLAHCSTQPSPDWDGMIRMDLK